MTAVARLLRTTGAGVTLIAILVGLPILLWQLGAPLLPDHVPHWQEALDALRRPDDGRLFLGALTLLGFLAWIMLTTSILVELAATLRGRVARQIRFPGFGLSQALAGTLVAAVLTSPGSQAVAASLPSPSLASQVSPAAPPAGDATAAVPVDEHTGPSYRVLERDTLWDIAQRSLGEPLRWREIVELNGLTENAVLQVGVVLRLPPDAVSPVELTVTVAPGDTLSAIAHVGLGAADRYPELFRLNAGRPQPDGDSLRDPDLIRPGWRLMLRPPAEGPQTGQPHAPGTPSPDPDARPGGEPPSQVPRESPKIPDTGSQSPSPRSTTQAPAPTATAPSPESSGNGSGGAAPAAEPVAAAPAAVPAALTLSGLLAAGLLSALAIRRRRQRRHRGGYRQIAVPDPSAGRLEWAAEEAADTNDIAFLNLALRSLSAALAADETSLEPDVLAAWLGPAGMRLILSEPCTPVEPFVASGGDEHEWFLPSDAPLPVTDDTAGRHLASLPALTTVGHDADDHLLLDLERLAVLHITGDPGRVAELLTYITAELAHNQWCDGLDVLLVGFGADLAALDPERLRHVDDVESAMAHMRGKLAATQESLSDHHLDTTLTGRARDVAGDAWTPTILLVTGDASLAEPLAPLAEELTQAGRTAAAIVVACPDAVAELPGWRLEVGQDGALAVPGLTDRSVTAERLTPQVAAGLVQMVAAASMPDAPVLPADDPRPWARDMNADGSYTPPPVTTHVLNGSSEQPDTDAPHEADDGEAALATETPDDESTVSPEVVQLHPDLQRTRERLAAVESLDPELDADLAAWLAADPAGPPLVSVLGEPTVRASGVPPEYRLPFFTEIVVYLAFHPRGKTIDELQTDIWADGKVTKSTLRRCVSEVRRWLGQDITQNPPRPHLPNISSPGGAYRLRGHLFDWDLFRRLRKRGQARIAAQHAEAGADHTAALRLVRAPVLRPLRFDRYLWVVRDRPDLHIPGFIVDTAHELVDHSLASDDSILARWAADTARMVDPDSSFDRPLLDLIRVAYAEDNHGEVERFAKILMYAKGVEESVELPWEIYEIIHKLFPGGLRATGTDRG